MATLTVFPDPNVEVSSVDGFAEISDAVWATARGAATGGSASDSGGVYSTYCAADLNLGTYTITRTFWLFDTSALTAGATISAAVASFAAAGGASTNADTTAMHIVASTPASNTAITTADYDQIGSTTFGNITIANWVTTNNTYNDITLNASGLAAISKTGITKFAGRLALDLNDVAPTGNNYIGSGYFADNAGTSSDPKLVITYTAPAGPANVKTFNTITLANTKIVNGIAIASVKTKSGIA